MEPDDAVGAAAPGAAPPREPGADDLVIVTPALAEHLRAIRRRVRSWLRAQQWPEDAAEDIELATDEALANSVDHAYSPGAPGPMSVHAWVTGEPDAGRRVVVSVTDHGRWAHHHPATRGRGIVVMTACTAEMHIQHSARGTTVVMVSHTVPRPGAA